MRFLKNIRTFIRGSGKQVFSPVKVIGVTV